MTTRLLMLLIIVLAGLVLAFGLQPPAPLPANDSTPGPSTFDEAFHLRLLEVQEAAITLVELGETRERNLLVVGQRQSAMNAVLDSTDAWLTQQQAREDDPAVASYRSGAASIRSAMSDAQSAFIRFDWDGVAAANDTLKAGVDQIDAAIAETAGREPN
jgi:hypothetical protein